MAGVSRSAVSRAYTPGASVSRAMRARIEKAAAALGYRPNLIARSLSTQRRTTVAVAMTRLENAFHAALLHRLATGLQERGFQVLLFLTDPTSDTDPPIEELLRHRVAAIILSAVRLSSHYAHECRSAGVPTLLVNRLASDAPVASVVGDNRTGGKLVAELFARVGHHRPIFIAGSDDSSTSLHRQQGFTEGLAQAGITPLPPVNAGFSQSLASDVVRRLLSAAAPPDAIFCANDHMATAALQVARHEFGLKVGEEVSIVGYDDSPIAKLADIALTTVAQPVDRFATAALEVLDQLMAEPEAAPPHRLIEARLIERASSRKSAP